jgi:ABC-type transport system involved in multi-copper enzyme maturation permease subunit
MSVNKRGYRSFAGPLTPPRWRFTVIARYGLADVWQSRVTNILFVLCLIPSLVSMFLLYIVNSPAARIAIGMQNMPLFAVDQRWFLQLLTVQCWIALLPAAWIGPRLISQDLSHNALPIILSRSITRREYVLGKLVVLWGLLSAVTWVPLLLMFAFQAHMSAVPWASAHWFIATGMLAASLIWIVLLSFLALALSAWVRWRIVATALVFGAIFVAAGFGTVFNAVMRSNLGTVISLPQMNTQLWFTLLRVPIPSMWEWRVPIWMIAVSMAVICTACGAALNARIRAREVVRG